MNPFRISSTETDTASPPKRHLPIIVSLILAALILSNMALIFFFSAENGEDSGNRSAWVTDIVLKVIRPDFDSLPQAEQQHVEANVHHLVRKTAHFLEYAVLGFLFACLLLWLKHVSVWRIRLWQAWVFPVALGLFYAVSDEVHQIFSQRGARVTDVLIDLTGVIFGVCMAHVATWLLQLIRTAKKTKAGKETAHV